MEPDRQVLEFDCGVVAYEPATENGYWRLRWVEDGRRRDTSAKGRTEAIARAEDLVERLSAGRPEGLTRAKAIRLVEHYLDPSRTSWSERHRDAQISYCERFVAPVIGQVPLRDLTRAHFQKMLDQASSTAVEHLRRCLSAMVNVGLDEGLLLARQDVLRGLRFHGVDARRDDPEACEDGLAVTEADIPTAEAVAALAKAAADLQGVWWRELEILLVAYSGLRWGEHAALSPDRLKAGRRIVVDRQLIETRSGVKFSAPKNRKRRITMYPARTPTGVELAEMVSRRLVECGASAIVFPSPRGRWQRRSNFRRNVFLPAAEAAGWPRHPDGRLQWTFHSLRHVFATWALAQPGTRIEDVSRLLGHSSIRVTQDIYIGVDSDIYDRFYDATA
ncbi:MAG TPA: tyrosine-type recombinase/integrase [Acidimicrobiales bacterium]|nr:tyrosine-type recombinase/integrase [Acidimicrobiales bacterium]